MINMASAKEGVYIPPFRLQRMRNEVPDRSSAEFQKLMWTLLRKSLNGIINKVNISNLPKVIFELFNENLIRGRGLLARSLLKGQLAAPIYTHVYAALVALINSKLPAVGKLIVFRLIQQFQKAYRRNDKLTCIGSLKFIAHLFNQKVVHELLPLQAASLLIENATDDSVEIACEFVVECGQVLGETTPLGMTAIFERLRTILQEGQISKRVQYGIENLMRVRKERFKDHPGVLQQLDLVEDAEQVTHEIALDDELLTEEDTNVFKVDPEFEKNEQEWEEIKKEILGSEESEEEDDEEDEAEKVRMIIDQTDTDNVNLRRVIYLNIMSSVDFEECANKMLKLKIRQGQEEELAAMLVECCMHERTFLRFYGLLAQRFCVLDPIYTEHFERAFERYYDNIDKYETNKIRNLAKFFAHLLFTDAVSWTVFRVIRLTEETTTSSSRIFIKILLQEIAENISIDDLLLRFKDKEIEGSFDGLFLKDIPKNVRLCINFFTSIGLGGLTDELRDCLQKMTAAQMEIEENASEPAESSSSSESAGHSAKENSESSSQYTNSSGASRSSSSSGDSNSRSRPQRKRSYSSYSSDSMSTPRRREKSSSESRKAGRKNIGRRSRSGERRRSRSDDRRRRSRSDDRRRRLDSGYNERAERSRKGDRVVVHSRSPKYSSEKRSPRIRDFRTRKS
jgi:pre-mRNA-splicing factor CWC22